MSDGKEVKDADRGPHESWCDTQNNISERCNCMASSYIDSLVSYETVVTELRAEAEVLKVIANEAEAWRNACAAQVVNQDEVNGHRQKMFLALNEYFYPEIAAIEKEGEKDG